MPPCLIKVENQGKFAAMKEINQVSRLLRTRHLSGESVRQISWKNRCRPEWIQMKQDGKRLPATME